MYRCYHGKLVILLEKLQQQQKQSSLYIEYCWFYLTEFIFCCWLPLSGKAAYAMLKDMKENPKKWEGRKILFIHTGGLLGLYDKVDQMASFVGNWQRMDVNESVPRQDGVGKMF